MTKHDSHDSEEAAEAEKVHQGTEALQEIADDVVRERERTGSTEFDAPAGEKDDSDGESGAEPDIPMGSVGQVSQKNSPHH